MNDYLVLPVMNNNALLLKFHATWCEPCKWAEPVIAEALSLLDRPVKFEKVDVDESPEKSKEHRVMSVPTFILLVNGKEVWRMNGFDTATKMASAIQSALTSASH